MAWLADLDPVQRLGVVYAMAFAFPLLKNDKKWKAYTAEVTDEVAPSPEQQTEITIAAMKMSERLKRERAG
jgi:hypothetical protein